MQSRLKDPFTIKLTKQKPSVIRLKLSLLIAPRVITLSGFYCTTKTLMYPIISFSRCTLKDPRTLRWKQLLKERCDTRFQFDPTNVITYFENATACSKRTLKTRVATQLYGAPCQCVSGE